MTKRLNDWTHIKARALHLGKKINVRAVHDSDRRAETSLPVPAGGDGSAVLFPYGVAVLFNPPRTEETTFSTVNEVRLLVIAGVEWCTVILIVVEIAIYLYGILFLNGGHWRALRGARMGSHPPATAGPGAYRGAYGDGNQSAEADRGWMMGYARLSVTAT